jgi:transcriptional regulator with XRE-family HTH domain
MLSEALRLIRVFHDVKQSELALRFGISKSYLSELESGKKPPPIDLIEKYATEFKIPASSILFFSERLRDGKRSSDFSEKARGVIASKVLNFLRLIESKTEDDIHEAS